MDPITLILAGGLIGSAIGNWWQNRQIKELQQQVAVLVEINAKLQQQLLACQNELQALRFWNLRKKAAYRREINALHDTVNWLTTVIQNRDPQQVSEALQMLQNVA